MLHYTNTIEARKWLGSKIALYGGKNADDSDIEEDLAISEGMIDTYLSAGYETPLSDAGQIRLVKGFAKWFFLEQAYARGSSVELPAVVANALKRIEKTLNEIASGKQFLGGVAPQSTSPAMGSVIVSGAEALRDREGLSNF